MLDVALLSSIYMLVRKVLLWVSRSLDRGCCRLLREGFT